MYSEHIRPRVLARDHQAIMKELGRQSATRVTSPSPPPVTGHSSHAAPSTASAVRDGAEASALRARIEELEKLVREQVRCSCGMAWAAGHPLLV